MKVKYLLGSLLGGALLAACTADDALDLKSASGVNPSAPVFVVSFDGEEELNTRAEMTETGKLTFQKGDLMSLFHGESSWGSLVGADNAIYKADDNSEDDPALKFTTHSMVKGGHAVMVWPADTTFQSRTAGSVNVRISLNQKLDATKDQKNDKNYLEYNTWIKTPYISEVLNIQGYGSYDAVNTANSTNTEGYAREYQVKLKRIGSTLKLDVLRTNETDLTKIKRADGKDAKGITFKTVKIETADVNPFTSEIPVIGENGKPTKYSNVTTSPYYIWQNVSTVDVDNIVDADNNIITNHILNPAYEKANTISTAYFTLLPTNQAVAQEKDADVVQPTFSKAKVTVDTYYGTIQEEGTAAGQNIHGGVTQVTDNAQVKWYKNYGKTAAGTTMANIQRGYSVRGGLNEFLSVMYSAATDQTPDFKGENIGHVGTRTLVVDMRTMIMNGLHIENEDQLLDVMAVYKEISQEQVIRLYLDGDKNGQFKMSQVTWKEVEKQMGGRLVFIPCQQADHECDEIVLVADSKQSVPDLYFGKDTGADHPISIQDPKAVTVILEGDWTYDGTEKLAGIDVLNVADESTLLLKNNQIYVAASHSVAPEANFCITNDGEVTVDGDIKVGVNMINYNTVKIGENQTLIMNQNQDKQPRIFINEGGQPTGSVRINNALIANSVKAEYGGVVENAGWFGIEDRSESKIYNYGTAYLKNNDARLYITANATSATAYSSKYVGTFAELDKVDNGNKIGSIVLFDKTAGTSNVKVNESDLQGFIKLFLEDQPTTPVNAQESDFGKIANYIVVGATTKTFKNSPATTEVDGGKVAYVEFAVTGAANEVQFVEGTTTTLTGYIHNPVRKVNIPEKTKVIVTDNAYVKHYLSLGGIFANNPNATLQDMNDPTSPMQVKYTGYFGGVEEDYKNVTTY